MSSTTAGAGPSRLRAGGQGDAPPELDQVAITTGSHLVSIVSFLDQILTALHTSHSSLIMKVTACDSTKLILLHRSDRCPLPSYRSEPNAKNTYASTKLGGMAVMATEPENQEKVKSLGQKRPWRRKNRGQGCLRNGHLVRV